VNEPHITLSGNLAFDPKLRFTPTGISVLNLRVAATPRIKRAEEWGDGETLWFDVVCWKQLAENAAESLHRGDTVTVQGRLFQRTWSRDDGTQSTTLTVEATHVGVDLGRYPARVDKPLRARPEDAFGDRFVNTVTGEVLAEPAADVPHEPLTEEDRAA
jgi:single-strand DNA-binding protein